MTIRDAERMKDKIEVSLDNRQIVVLFFGGAVVACLVFVLGVMVGRRLEGRERVAQKAATSAQIDPLAALDELGADEQADDKAGDLAFATALAAEGQKHARAEAKPAKEPPKEAAQSPAKATKEAKETAKPESAAPAAKEVPAEAAVAPEVVADKADKAKDAKDSDKDKPKKKQRFTLQISSFQDRGEADALLAKLVGAGYKPFLVTSSVPDKGVFFRVRVGDFGSKSDAQDAKAEFEKKQHLLAYVTKT
jgi:cell division septation protein DedD